MEYQIGGIATDFLSPEERARLVNIVCAHCNSASCITLEALSLFFPEGEKTF